MRKKTMAAVLALLMLLSMLPVPLRALERRETPDYKVAFFAFDCYHIQDENGKRSGYGYEMMEGIAKYLQCTFTYVGYENTAAESVEMLRQGQVDLYTAAKRTPEREAEFAFSTHPSITSYTCMNVKVGNNKIVSGDYSTYDGLRIGLLRRHTYNDAFLDFVKEKGFQCDIVYYDSPTELSSALVNDEVDALVNSYIRIPEDEKTIENFGETPYYIMARKEDQALIEKIDAAMDSMNVETPNWRTELYNKYYGSVGSNRELTAEETAYLHEMQESGEPIKAVMDPDAAPYSWFEDGEACGIVADIFRATAEELGLSYEILPVADQAAYEEAVRSGEADIWMDMDSEDAGDGARYKATDAYLTTTMSVLRNRGASEKIETLVIHDDDIPVREILSSVWPTARVLTADSPAACRRMVLTGEADGALLMSYTVQRLARDDVQNRLRAEVVPGATLTLMMGVNAQDRIEFYGIWEKTLSKVAERISDEVVQEYLEQTATPNLIEYLFDHPMLLTVFVTALVLALFMLLLAVQSTKSRKKQEAISGELASALKKAEEATEAKQNFFSKMSHDIRTPLNVVLGMTQVAQKYKHDEAKLDNALGNINREGNYLLVLINSILDVNQLEHGMVELIPEPFDPEECVKESADLLRPLSGKKEQSLTVRCPKEQRVLVGDVNRLRQIIINIVSNAIKYTGVGGHIDLTLEYPENGRCRFTCADNGIGMSADFVQHICEDFTRAEDSRVSKTQGTGLGMAVVKGFTERMGGTLQIQSELGKGSTFIVELPFREADEAERKAFLHPPAEREAPEYAGKKVLLVEDNALNAEIATELLETIGLRVDWAENGEAGLERYRNSKPDEYFAVFMDMQMPVMDGVTATKEIRKSKRADHDIPIFAMTANTFASDRRSCREAGMTGYIAKPVSVQDIENALTVIEP